MYYFYIMEYDFIRSEIMNVKLCLENYVIYDIACIVMEYCKCDVDFSLPEFNCIKIYLRKFIFNDLEHIVLEYCKYCEIDILRRLIAFCGPLRPTMVILDDCLV